MILPKRTHIVHYPISEFTETQNLIDNLKLIKKISTDLVQLYNINKRNNSKQYQESLQKLIFNLQIIQEQAELVLKQLKLKDRDQDEIFKECTKDIELHVDIKHNGCQKQYEKQQFIYTDKREINVLYLEILCGNLNKNFLGQLIKILKSSFNYIEKQIDQITYISQLFKFLQKFSVFSKLRIDKDDIIAQPPEKWQKIDEKIFYKTIIYDQKKLQRKMEQFQHYISLPLSVFHKSGSGANEANIFKNCYQLMLAGYYFFSKKDSINQTKKYLSDPYPSVVLNTWKGLDDVFPMKMWNNFNKPFIKYDEVFYFYKQYEEMNLDQINGWVQSGDFYKYEKMKMVPVVCDDIYTNLNKKQKKVKVRLISNKKIIEKKHSQQETFLSKINIFKNIFSEKKVKQHNHLIIHIHGGGWVSMSSESHSMYLRKWAKNPELKDTPIISIDYSLSPENQYPTALDDCWQTYLFIINNLDKHFNINPEKIIITGDSAGGNMAMGICQLCYKFNIKMPDGIFLSYPAFSLSFEKYSPSINYALIDFIAPFPFLEICKDMYLQDEKCNPDKDPLISPLLASDSFIKQLPPVKIAVGEEDLLKDDCIRFLNKLVKNGHQNCFLVIYKALRHGYLNFDVPFVLPETRKCSSDGAIWMSEMLFKHNINQSVQI